MRSESLSTLEKNVRRFVGGLSRDKTAILGDDGVPAAYLVDPATYQAALERLEILDALSRAEDDMEAGRTLTHALSPAKDG